MDDGKLITRFTTLMTIDDLNKRAYTYKLAGKLDHFELSTIQDALQTYINPLEKNNKYNSENVRCMVENEIDRARNLFDRFNINKEGK